MQQNAMPGFSTVSGTRTAENVDINYLLLLPESPGPHALAILLHGFGGHKEHLIGHAQRLAALGIAAFVPDMASLLRIPWETSQKRNIALILSHVDWLLSAKSPVTIDPARIMMIGHSAGLAVLFEACVALQAKGTNPACVISLDGVPWPRTVGLASSFDVTRTKFISIRCEPDSWNKNGELHRTLVPILAANCEKAKTREQKEYLILDIRVPGARHGDPIDPAPEGLMFRFMGLIGKSGSREAIATIVEAAGNKIAAETMAAGKVADESCGLEHLRSVLAALAERVTVSNVCG